MPAYYNEIDPEAVEVLRELAACGVIAPGDVDSRSIKEVTADDIRGYDQCHFFAGAGLWSVAAGIAGWPDTRPLWTASCPCQPWSGAGKQAGADDPRHLWPDLYRLIRSARAAGQRIPVLVGEQVAGSLGYGWFDGVRADLAREEIAARTIDIPACAVDAPHERNRLWWCAVADAEEQRSGAGFREAGAQRHGSEPANGHGGNIVLANADGIRGNGWGQASGREAWTDAGVAQRDDAGRVVDATGERWRQGRAEPDVLGRRATTASADVRQHGDVGDTLGTGLERHRRHVAGAARGRRVQDRPVAAPNHRNGTFWSDAEWIACHDGKARRAKPGIPMLVDGMAGRASVWRLAGNSIVPQIAAEVLTSILEAEEMMAAKARLASDVREIVAEMEGRGVSHTQGEIENV